MDIIDKGQLMTLNVENCHLQPLIAKALEVNADTVDVWLEGNYTKLRKVAKRTKLHQVAEGGKKDEGTHFS